MKHSSPINNAIDAQLKIMEHCLHDMLSSVQTAQQDIQNNHRNAAIGALLNCEGSFTAVKQLYDTILTMHRHADLVERD